MIALFEISLFWRSLTLSDMVVMLMVFLHMAMIFRISFGVILVMWMDGGMPDPMLNCVSI